MKHNTAKCSRIKLHMRTFRRVFIPIRMWAETHWEILQHTILLHHLIALLSFTAFVMGNWLSWQTLSLFIAQRLAQKKKTTFCKNIWRQDVEDFWWKLPTTPKARSKGNDSLLFLFSPNNLSAWCKDARRLPRDKMDPTFWLRTRKQSFGMTKSPNSMRED